MMLESRARAEHGVSEGTGSAPACAAQVSPAGVATHHVAVVSLDSSAGLQLGWVLDVLVEANRIGGKANFSWEVLSLADYADVQQRRGSRRLEAAFESRSAVFIAGDRLHLRLNDVERERFRSSVRQLDMALACGAGVELFAACSLLQGHTAAACRRSSLWLREEFPGISFRNLPLCWHGTIGTSAGGVAIAAVMLELLARLGLRRLAREIRGRLLLPTLKLEPPGLSPRVRFGAQSSKIVKAISFMQENLEGALSVSVVASHIGSSVRQLERLFKVQMKTTPARFLKRLRMEQAQALLLNTDLSVVQVVCAAGFESPTHFSKSFKREVGVSPSKWRSDKRRALARQPEGGAAKAGPAPLTAHGRTGETSIRSNAGAGTGFASCSSSRRRI